MTDTIEYQADPRLDDTALNAKRMRHVRRDSVPASRFTILFVCAFAIAVAPTHLAAQTTDSEAHAPSASDRERTSVLVLPIHNGLNHIDLLGNGKPGQVIVSRRDNGNAHGFSVVLFQVLAPSNDMGRSLWQVVPFFGGPHDSDTGEALFGTTEGADCTLRDLRIIRRAAGSRAEVVTATRDFGQSFADSAPVQFDFYELRDGADGSGPSYLFRHVRTVQTKGHYCDVDDAFDRELGLGTAGVLLWDGPR